MSTSHLMMPAPVYNIPLGSFSTYDVTSHSKTRSVEDIRNISRTPSPTPSEYNLLHGIEEPRSASQQIVRLVIIAVVVAVTVLLTVFSKKIVHALQPDTDWLRSHSFGPVIPIALLIIVSFPPLFGHEIIATLVGVTWNLPEALAIVFVGTLLGEIAVFFLFKYSCTARMEKREAKDLDYALLAHVVRNGGFLVVVIIRYSAIPSHFSTAVFSAVGVSFWIFLSAAILSLPKQFLTVYTGYVTQPGKASGATNTIETVVLIVGIVITIGALKWIKRQKEDAKSAVIYARRKARQAGGHYQA